MGILRVLATENAQMPDTLEVEFQGQLHGSVAELVGHDASSAGVDWCSAKISNRQLECRVAAQRFPERVVVQESVDGMIQEVEGFSPELQVLRLAYLEGFEN